MLLEFEVFEEEIDKTIYGNTKSKLLNKIATSPDRYIGLFRTTSPKMKLMQNLTQSHEISFGDFVENIITMYFGLFYKNLPKKANYKNELILFDQLFIYENTIYMIEQKIRDDHDSTKKRGQFVNFVKKIKYLQQEYPTNKISASMWFVDNSLMKNKRYYLNMMETEKAKLQVELNLFYGDELFIYLDQMSIWDEMITYLFEWKQKVDNDIDLNFEKDWEETKKEIYEFVSKGNWEKLLNNNKVVDQIFPILFPTERFKEIYYD